MKYKKEEKFTGKITISRVTSNLADPAIHITIEDCNFIRFFDGELTISDYGNAISGVGAQPIECTLRGLDIVNKKAERKTVEINILNEEFVKCYNDKRRLEIAKEFISPFEVDGWKADLSQINNSHYYSHDKMTLKINFIRYVEKGEESK